MSSMFTKAVATLLVGGVMVVAVPRAFAQVRVDPHVGYQLPASTQIGAATANWSQATQGGNRPAFNGGYNRNPGYVGGGGYGYNPYGSYNAMTPAYGYLSGASEVIGAQSQYMISQQQAAQMQEDLKQQKLQTSRKTWDEWKYEQSIMPTAEENRVKLETAEINRMRNNPPSIDIWSGEALNTLLRDIQKQQSVGMIGPSVALDPATLKMISVTDGTSYGQGNLQDGGKLTWPYALELEYFESGRKRMEGAMNKAYGQLATGKRVEAKLITEMYGTEEDLRASLKTHINDLTPTQGVQARRYINELHETIRTLEDAKASNFVSGKWAARGDNVAELVADMSKNGLRFAPAASGNQSAYSALYQAMVGYDRMIAGTAFRQ